MTLKEYRQFCEKFFKEDDFWSSKEKIQSHASSLTLEDYRQWQVQVIEKYDKHAIGVIRELVSKIRNGYCPINDDESKDPLKNKKNKNLQYSYREIYDTVFENNFWSLPVIEQRNAQWADHIKQKTKQDAFNIEVNGEKFKALAMCPVLWSGWECDANVWIVEQQGQKKLVNSSHGQTQFTNKDFLEDKIKEYEQAIEESKKILALMSQ